MKGEKRKTVKTIKIDVDKCNGCRACEVICSALHAAPRYSSDNPARARIRVIRDSRLIGDYAIDSLRREKEDAREVRDGMECGIKLAGFNDIKEGDLLEAYRVEGVARTFE